MANTDKELGYLAPLKTAVGQAESKGIYHNYNQGVPTGANEKEEDARHGDEQKLITEMTLRELMDYQKKPPGDRNRIFAAGKYQIVPNTLKELLSYKSKKLGRQVSDEVLNNPNKDIFKIAKYEYKKGPDGQWIMSQDNPNKKKKFWYNDYYEAPTGMLDTKFDEDTQEELGSMLFLKKRPAISKYLKGEGDVSIDDAALSLAKEFASMPKDSSGLSFYQGQAQNEAKIGYDAIKKILEKTKKAYDNSEEYQKTYDPLESFENIYSIDYPEDDYGMEYDTPAKMAQRPKVIPVEPKAPLEKPAPAPTPAPVSQKIQEEKPKKAQPSSGDSPKDYSDYPFKEAFDMAKNRDKQKVFSWEGRLFTTVTSDELLAKSSKPTPAVEDKPAKEGKVEDYLDKAPEPLAEYKPAPGDMLGGELFSMLPRYPVPDIMDKKEPVKKSKVSDILKKTTEPDYDKMSFEEAFKAKRAKGEKEFPWRGKTYTTKYKEEM